MSIIIEDGTGLDTAQAYADEASVTAYLEARGRADENAWADAIEAEQEAAIIRATDYIEGRFAGRWRGRKLTQAQALAWPRAGGYDDDGFAIASDAVPALLVAALAEYAVRALGSALLPDPSAAADNTSGRVTRVMERVGEVVSDVSYSDTQRLSAGELRAYPAADLLIARLTVAASMFGRVGRA